jgi:hypothetical protein
MIKILISRTINKTKEDFLLSSKERTAQLNNLVRLPSLEKHLIHFSFTINYNRLRNRGKWTISMGKEDFSKIRIRQRHLIWVKHITKHTLSTNCLPNSQILTSLNTKPQTKRDLRHRAQTSMSMILRLQLYFKGSKAWTINNSSSSLRTHSIMKIEMPPI